MSIESRFVQVFSGEKICYDSGLLATSLCDKGVVMRRLFVFLAFCGPFFWVATAWAAPVLFVESVAFDFGHIVQGEQVEYTFRFRNAGDELLEISQLRSSCGCTAALLSTPRLAPGTVGELQVKFDSHGFRGRVQEGHQFRYQ